MDINNILHEIQQELSVPKNQYNKFGGYNYRSCEDIVEAVKKLLPGGVTLTLFDHLESHADRVFVKAGAKLSCGDSFITGHGCAEVAKEQKGMQAAQITGSASSYARKYALNGLFCIDDTKDADATNQHEVMTSKQVKIEVEKSLEIIKGATEEEQTKELGRVEYKRIKAITGHHQWDLDNIKNQVGMHILELQKAGSEPLEGGQNE